MAKPKKTEATSTVQARHQREAQRQLDAKTERAKLIADGKPNISRPSRF